jgi:uncharacterized RDD family membrane protein YckC
MPENSTVDLKETPTPGFIRRLAAILYDALLLLALMLVATSVITLPLGYPSGLLLLVFQIFLFEIIPLLFFTRFWTHGGQTLGMRAWRLKLVRMDGGEVTWNDAVKRHFSAILSFLALGLGFIWILVDEQHLAWHDRLSQTRLLIVD